MPDSTESTVIVADEVVTRVERQETPLPEGWGARALYLGTKGSQNWVNVVNEPNYPLQGENPYDLHRNRLTAVESIRPATFVSLGSGDGSHDMDIIVALRQRSVDLEYIPVDISRRLLDLTIQNLAPHVRINVGVQCDFERSSDFFANVLQQYARRPMLLGLLGGTFGNLDRGARVFLARIRQLLESDDVFLFDVPLAGPGWNAEDEPRLRAAGYSDTFRRFLGGAISQCAPSVTEDAFVRNFAERVAFSVEHDDETGSEMIIALDRPSGCRIANGRYHWDVLLAWLKSQGFTILFSKCSSMSPEDRFGMGVVLLSGG